MSSRNRSKTARKLARQVRADGDSPQRRTMELFGNGGGVKTSVIKDAVREAGHDPEDPGAATHVWFRELDMVVIDLRGADDVSD